MNRTPILILLCSIHGFLSCTYLVEPIQTNNCHADTYGPPDIPNWQKESISRDSFITETEAYFTSEKAGFLFGLDGAIWATTDGGTTWNKTYEGPFDYLTAMFFYDDYHGFATGMKYNANGLVKTADGGENWTLINYGNNDRITNLFFIDSLKGFAIFHRYGDPTLKNIFTSTEDGGITWKEIPGILASVIANYFTEGLIIPEIKIFPDGFGYFAGDTSQIYLTHDFGKSWNAVQTGLSWLTQVQFINEDIGFAGDLTKLIKTTDGGASWDVIAEHGTLFIHFNNENEGVTFQTVSSDFHSSREPYTEDCNSFLITSDGGLTWIEGEPSENFVPNNLQFINEGFAIASSSYQTGLVMYRK